jgi:hypothetical protein
MNTNTYEVQTIHPNNPNGTYDKIVEASSFEVNEAFVHFLENSTRKLSIPVNRIVSIERVEDFN